MMILFYIIITCIFKVTSSIDPMNLCSTDGDCIHGSVCLGSECVGVQCRTDEHCAKEKGYRCVKVGFNRKCVHTSSNYEISLEKLKTLGSQNCTSNDQCNGLKCFKPDFQSKSGVCLKSFGVCRSDCDCIDTRLFCHATSGLPGNCFCTRVNQKLCGENCTSNKDCDSCSVCLSGMCANTPGIKGCQPKAKETCVQSPMDVCSVGAQKKCCTDCDCINKCEGSFCHPCKGTCVGPKPWNCESGTGQKTRIYGITEEKFGGLCNSNASQQCPINHCCKNSFCTPNQICNLVPEFQVNDPCEPKEITVYYGTNPDTNELSCACSCDGSDPAKVFAKKNRQPTSQPDRTSHDKKPAKQSAADLGEYFDKDHSSGNSGSESKCSGKYDSPLDIVYTADGTCKCSCQQAVDGKWSGWSEWSKCTLTCNGGSRTRSRACNDPAPSGIGKPCQGAAEEKEACNTNICPCCNCDKIMIEADTCILCEIPDVNGTYISQGIDANKETCTYSKTFDGRTLELISHPQRKGWGILLGRNSLAFGRVQGKDLSPTCPVYWKPTRGWQSLTKKDASNVALYIGNIEISCFPKNTSPHFRPAYRAAVLDKKALNEMKISHKYKSAKGSQSSKNRQSDLAFCCEKLSLTYDHCLDCFFDGYIGIYTLQQHFYLNLEKNLFVYQNPSGSWSVGSSLESEGASSVKPTDCPNEKNVWQFYHPDLKTYLPVFTFNATCI